MTRRRCCCCTLFQDHFAREFIGGSWDVVDGSWDIMPRGHVITPAPILQLQQYSKLYTSDDAARIDCLFVKPTLPIHLSTAVGCMPVELSAGPPPVWGDTPTAVIYFDDGRGRVTIEPGTKAMGGTEDIPSRQEKLSIFYDGTLLGSSANWPMIPIMQVPGPGNRPMPVTGVCLEIRKVSDTQWKVIAQTNWCSCEVAIDNLTSAKIGLGAGIPVDGGEVDFLYFILSKNSQERAECPRCEACNCDGTMPDCITLTLQNFDDPGSGTTTTPCVECVCVDGKWSLQRVKQYPYYDYYAGEWYDGGMTCAYTIFPAHPNVEYCYQRNLPWAYAWIEHRTDGYYARVSFGAYVPGTPTSHMELEWEKFIGTTKPDCNSLSLTGFTQTRDESHRCETSGVEVSLDFTTGPCWENRIGCRICSDGGCGMNAPQEFALTVDGETFLLEPEQNADRINTCAWTRVGVPVGDPITGYKEASYLMQRNPATNEFHWWIYYNDGKNNNWSSLFDDDGWNPYLERCCYEHKTGTMTQYSDQWQDKTTLSYSLVPITPDYVDTVPSSICPENPGLTCGAYSTLATRISGVDWAPGSDGGAAWINGAAVVSLVGPNHWQGTVHYEGYQNNPYHILDIYFYPGELGWEAKVDGQQVAYDTGAVKCNHVIPSTIGIYNGGDWTNATVAVGPPF